MSVITPARAPVAPAESEPAQSGEADPVSLPTLFVRGRYVEAMASEMIRRGFICVQDDERLAVIAARRGHRVIDVFVAPPSFPGLISLGVTVPDGKHLQVMPITVRPIAMRLTSGTTHAPGVIDWPDTANVVRSKIVEEYT